MKQLIQLLRIPSIIILLCLIAGPARAEDNLYQSPDDLSAKDKVAAEHLQKLIDAENKAAHDKAEREWQKEHSPSGGGDPIGGAMCLSIPLLIIGGVILARNKRAAKVYFVFCGIGLSALIIAGYWDSYSKSNTPSLAQSLDPAIEAEQAAKAQREAAEQAKIAEIKELQRKLDERITTAFSKGQHLDLAKQQVTHFWQLYCFYKANAPRPKYSWDSTESAELSENKDYYDKWLYIFQSDSQELKELQRQILDLESLLATKTMGMTREQLLTNGIHSDNRLVSFDPSTGQIKAIIDTATGLPILDGSQLQTPTSHK